jgi:chromosome segregation ATPase
MSRDPYKVKLTCSIPKPSTVSDCEIVLKRLSCAIEPFQSKVDNLTNQMSTHQTEILRLQKMIDSANSEVKKLQKENQQNMCVEKWHDELNKKNEACCDLEDDKIKNKEKEKEKEKEKKNDTIVTIDIKSESNV